MRSASADDRRYLLYSPLTKAKVTSEGERVIIALWDVIAAKGVEKDTFFETVAREIGPAAAAGGHRPHQHRAARQVHAHYLFAPDAALPLISRRDDAADDTFLFNQGPPAAGQGALPQLARFLRQLRPPAQRRAAARAGRRARR
ncbi:acd9 domain protein, partial [Mycobacterium kansasii 662]